MDAWLSLAGSVLTGVLALVGVYIANRKSAALTIYRLEQLEKKVELHNKVIERTYKLEERASVLEEDLKVANHRIEDLEGKE